MMLTVVPTEETDLSSGPPLSFGPGKQSTLVLLTLLVYILLYGALAVVGTLYAAAFVLWSLIFFGRPDAFKTARTELTRLLDAISASLRLRADTRGQRVLLREEAPHLYETAAKCARSIGCAPPDAIAIELGVGACIDLRGRLAGRGKTTLLFGFGMLAASAQDELEPVIAHELAHARTIRRGMDRWIEDGAESGKRFVYLVGKLQNGSEEEGGGPRGSVLGKILHGIAIRLVMKATRLHAAYGWNKEFIADRAAVRACGADGVGNALLKTLVLETQWRAAGRLDAVVYNWRGGSITAWFRGKLLSAEPTAIRSLLAERLARRNHPQFDAQPSDWERLQAIGFDPGPTVERVAEPNAAHADPVPWLADSDGIAKELLARADRIDAEDEEQDTGKLEREFGTGRSAHFTLCRGTLAVTALAALVLLVACLAQQAGSVGRIVAGIGAAMFFASGCRTVVDILGRRRTVQPPELPDFAAFEAGILSRERADDALGRVDRPKCGSAEEPDLPDGLSPTLLKRALAEHWLQQGHKALAAGDLGLAFSCSIRCIRADASFADGQIQAAIAFALCHASDMATDAGVTALDACGRNPATHLALGCVALEIENWQLAEGLLLDAARYRPPHPTLYGALAMAQAYRGKFSSAIANYGRAIDLAPRSLRLHLRLAESLLDVGRLSEATAELCRTLLLPSAGSDRNVLLARARLHLLRGDDEAADHIAAKVGAAYPDAITWRRLAEAYDSVRRSEEAVRCHERAAALDQKAPG